MKRHLSSNNGNAIMIALGFSAIMFSLAASCFLTVQNKYRLVHQAACWNEALLSAESGIDLALVEIRKTLYDPANAWKEWRRQPGESFTDANGNGKFDLGELFLDTNGNGEFDATGAEYLTSTELFRIGEGGTKTWSQVSVDTPIRDAHGEPWYRIRCTGNVELNGVRPGSGEILAGDKPDRHLRKFSLRRDRRSSERLTVPLARRHIEVIAKPVGAFRLALFGVSGIYLSNPNIEVDSWDSRDPNKSNNGAYPFGDPVKRQWNGDIATNGRIIEANGAHIWGTASTNGGTVLRPENVSGHRENPADKIHTDFYQEVLPIRTPSAAPDPSTPTLVNGSTTLLAALDVPAQIRLSSINLSGEDVLRISNPKPGSDAFVQIVVTGNISVGGKAKINIDPGVFVRFFVEGNAEFGGQGFVNPNNALHLQLYGVDRPLDALGKPTSVGAIKIAGNGGFSGAVYAPHYNVEITGGGRSENIFGSFTGNTVRMTGVQTVHYDEALRDGGLITDFKITSWFEEDR